MTSHGHLAPGAVPGLFALALALASGAPPASAQAVQWRPDYGAARREAAERERPLVLVFSAASCTWCRQMERTTLRDPEVVGALNRRFVPVRVAADDARNGYLVVGLGLRGLPAVVLVAPGGRVLTTREGFLDAAGFLALLGRAPALGAGPGRGARATGEADRLARARKGRQPGGESRRLGPLAGPGPPGASRRRGAPGDAGRPGDEAGSSAGGFAPSGNPPGSGAGPRGELRSGGDPSGGPTPEATRRGMPRPRAGRLGASPSGPGPGGR